MSLETIDIKQISDDPLGSSSLFSRDGVVFLSSPLRSTHYTLRRTVAKSTLKKIRTTSTKSTYGIDAAKLYYFFWLAGLVFWKKVQGWFFWPCIHMRRSSAFDSQMMNKNSCTLNYRVTTNSRMPNCSGQNSFIEIYCHSSLILDAAYTISPWMSFTDLYVHIDLAFIGVILF